MKKLLLSVLAISALVACSKSDVIEMPQSQAIKFGSAFIDNSTKAIDPSTTMDNFQTFKVWGKLTPTTTNVNGGAAISTNIFNGIDVTKSNTGNDIGTDGTNGTDITWYYDENNVQYWIPTVNYNFAAIAGTINGNVTLVDNMPSTIPYDVNTQTDLMYASTNTITGAANNNQTVSFTFSHLLSKVQFQFVNAYPEASDLYIKVTNVQIVNPYRTATYTISTSTWGSQAQDEDQDPLTDYTQSFGNVSGTNGANAAADYIAPGNGSELSNYARLMIPGTYKIDNDPATEDYPLQISFVARVYLKQGDNTYTEIDALSANFNMTNDGNPSTDADKGYIIPSSLTFANNCSYNLKITLGGPNALQPIKFSVSSITNWDYNNGVQGTTTEVPFTVGATLN